MPGTNTSRAGVMPVFIVGNVHSGTTLLRNIIGRNEAVFLVPDESRLFSQLSVLRRQHPDILEKNHRMEFARKVRDIIFLGYNDVVYQSNVASSSAKRDSSKFDLVSAIDSSGDPSNYADLIASIMVAVTRFYGKRVFVEKTPQHLFFMDRIIEVFPNARFIEVVRDPRDVLASKVRRGQDAWMSREKAVSNQIARLQRDYDPLWDSLGWRSAVNCGATFSKHSKEAILRLRYEDFVTDPKTELSRICAHIGIHSSLDMLSVGVLNASSDIGSESTGINAGAISKWENVLRPADVWLCQTLCKSEMCNLKYRTKMIPKTVWIGLPKIIGQSSVNLLERIGKSWRMFGFGGVVLRLTNYASRAFGLSRSTNNVRIK